jgi:hypothetical protein
MNLFDLFLIVLFCVLNLLVSLIALVCLLLVCRKFSSTTTFCLYLLSLVFI